MTSLPVGSVIRNSNTLFCCVRKGYWRPLKASGIGPGGFSDDELNDMGVSDLVLHGDGEIDDAGELYQEAIGVKASTAPAGIDLEKQYAKLLLGLPKTNSDLKAFLANINSLSKEELVELRKEAKDSHWRSQLLRSIEQYTGALRWMRKEFVFREDGTNKNVTIGTRVVTREQPWYKGATQGSVRVGHGVVEQAIVGDAAKKACGTTAACLVRFDPEKPEKLERAEEPEKFELAESQPKTKPQLNWAVVSTDAYGKPTERHARLPKLFWPDLAVVDYMSGPRYGARGRYEVMRRMSGDTNYYVGESAEEAWARTGFDFDNLTDLWKHLDEERELRLGKKR